MYISTDALLSCLNNDLYANSWSGATKHYPGQSLYDFRMTAVRNSLLKKYLPGTSGTTPATDAVALKMFLECNERCRVWKLNSDEMDSLDEVIVGEVKSLLHDFFFPVFSATEPSQLLCATNISRELLPGPGATIGTKATDFYSKLSTSALACTDLSLHRYYVDAISSDPTWAACEIRRLYVRGVDVVSSSRLSFVPKTTETSRTICTEPLLNMLFQKGIGRVLEGRLRQISSIDLSLQPQRNAHLARLGSQDGSFATLDLKNASDSISIGLLEFLLPREPLYWFKLCRTGRTMLPGGETIELHMVSSMGNGFTFPLQTLIFYAVVAAVYRAYGRRLIRAKGSFQGNFGVFGDDIIVETRFFARVVKILSLFGFIVNRDKSFSEGDFRESCGSDFFQGSNVRGVYIKQLRDCGDCYSAINRLLRWSATSGVTLWSTLALLSSKLTGRESAIYVPMDESDDAGIKVPLSCVKKWRLGANQTIGYRYRRLRPNTVDLPKDEGTCVLPGYFNNPDGKLLTLKAGYLRDGLLTLRSSERKADIRWRYTPRWDYMPPAYREIGMSGELWKLLTTVYLDDTR